MKLHVAGLKKSYNGNLVLTNASYTFEKGKIYGLLGRNGSGKTTMFNCLINNLERDSGDITIEFENGENRKTTFDDMGLVLAQPHLPEFMTGQEFIKFFVDINKDKITESVDMDASFVRPDRAFCSVV